MKLKHWLYALHDQFRAKPRRRSRRPLLIDAAIERLEERCLLSAAGGGAVMVFSVGTMSEDLPDVGQVGTEDLVQYDGNQFLRSCLTARTSDSAERTSMPSP